MSYKQIGILQHFIGVSGTEGERAYGWFGHCLEVLKIC